MNSETKSFTSRLYYQTPTKLPDELISSMIEYIEALTYDKATVDKSVVDTQVRSTDVAFIPWDEWIPGIMHSMIISANRSYFNYDLTYFGGRIQSTVYNGSNSDFYDWHVDTGDHSCVSEDLGGGKTQMTERKLSCSLILSDPWDYEGGELQFHYSRTFFRSIKPEKGTAIIFPSWLPHRVRPVKSGKRISLVGWMNGPLFR